jgi:hypothetical protein
MRTIAKVMALSIAAAALAAPAWAAAEWAAAAQSCRKAAAVRSADTWRLAIHPAVGGGLAGRSDATPGSTFAQQRQGGFASGQTAGGNDWWRHHRHHGYYPGAVYGYDYGYYGGDVYGEPDVNQCWVYHKMYNARGQFIGWRHVDVCAG